MSERIPIEFIRPILHAASRFAECGVCSGDKKPGAVMCDPCYLRLEHDDVDWNPETIAKLALQMRFSLKEVL